MEEQTLQGTKQALKERKAKGAGETLGFAFQTFQANKLFQLP